MSSKIVRDKVVAYLKANWTLTVMAGAENEIDNPPANLDPWLSVGFQGFDERVASIGSPLKQCLREEGMVYINVWVASGRGHDSALTFAEAARTMFRRLDLGDGLRFTTVDPPSTAIPSQAQSSSGNAFAYQVNASYIYDHQT